MQNLIETLPLAARRALLQQLLEHYRPAPLSKEALLSVQLGVGRWADVEGIPEEELKEYASAGEKLCTMGRLRDAKTVYTYLAQVDPFNVDHSLALGTIALDEEDHEQAENWFARAITLFGGDLGAHAGRAIARWKRGQFDEAQPDIEEALRLDPEGNSALTVRMAQLLTATSP